MTALGTRKLTLTVDGTVRTAEVSAVRLVSAEADSDFVTFADADAGGLRAYTLTFTAVQDPAAGSLWDEVWTNAGDDVPFVLAPNGGPVGANAPTFTGTATITEPDGDLLGGEANKSNTARMTFECAWQCLAKPVRAFA